MMLQLNNKKMAVKDLRDARAMLALWRDENGLGASDFAKSTGNVTEDGELVARISYNGKVTDVCGFEVKL